MNLFPIIVIATLVLASGCRKSEPVSAPAENPAAKTSVSIEALATKDTPPLAPAQNTPAAPATEKAAEDSTAPPSGVTGPPPEHAAGQMTTFVQQFFYEKGRLPKDLKELVTTPGYLPYIYPAPVGKKWVIDTKAKAVKLADK